MTLRGVSGVRRVTSARRHVRPVARIREEVAGELADRLAVKDPVRDGAGDRVARVLGDRLRSGWRAPRREGDGDGARRSDAARER